MKKIHGIIASKDGSYTWATVVNDTSGWQLHNSETWNINKTYKRYFLFHKGIHLGTECHWIKSDYLDSEKYISTGNCSPFVACLQPFQLQLHIDTFQFNLLGTHPDDLYLCTIPLYMQKNPRESFVSVYQEELCWKIAVIIGRKLISVYSFPITQTADLQCCMSRLERYWSTLKSEKEFPNTVYIFGNQELKPGDHYTVIRVDTSIRDLDTLKAAGIAFCTIDPDTPQFTGATEASRSRKQRSFVCFFSAALVILSLLFFGVLFLLNAHNQSRIQICQAEYNRILTDNKEIRELFSQGETLAAKLNRIINLSSNVTCWSRFLHQLGQQKPPRLFFERLGSEPVPGEKKVKIALSGWADNESTVTELIKNLNSSKLLSQISLSSMERDSKQKDYCRFKILCILTLSKS
jgi:Tfp pilus assembly protein PilN